MCVFGRRGPSGFSFISTAEQPTVGMMAGSLRQSLQELQVKLERELEEYSKCDKCSLVFCSSINYKRHIRVHRGFLNVDQEAQKMRGFLAAFWDKLSQKQVKEILAFDDVMLRDIPGSSLIKCLVSSLRKSGVSTLPQNYVKAGSTLLDIIQAKPSTLPISSQELFNFLDDASERTFLCAGTAESLQKYLFGGETVTVDLNLKNLIASISFLFELQLVKAWVADKDVETLRCQELLLEEEEAAQKREPVVLEKKTQRKPHRKEQKLKEPFYGGDGDMAINAVAADGPTSAEASQHSPPFDSSSHTPVLPRNLDSPLESLLLKRKECDEDIKAQFDSNSEPVNPWDLQTTECPAALKVWMQKCGKCSRAFCSPINCKRHVQMHRRSSNIDKVSHKSRNLLAAFWDKLSSEQVKEILAFDDVMLKEIPGSSVINFLASSLHKQEVLTLPEVYLNAGSMLLDIIHAKPSRLPISSQKLFSILDDASERTFLRAGTAESLRNYVFDGDTATSSLDSNNLIASTSFLFELQLVKAWVADKDAEALRCQKLKEEEAALKRQAKHLQRKTQKKLCAKKQKEKEQFCGDNADSTIRVVAADRPTSAEASKPSHPSGSSSHTPVLRTSLDSGLEPVQLQRKELNEDIKAQFDPSSEPINQGDSQIIEHPASPLLVPRKVQMRKCEKCSQEFCSTINYKRHVQVQCQSLNVDKDYHESRDLLAAFWDKLSFEEVKKILTFDDAMLKDIIQTISSQQLFSILDDASERTFLCGGAAESLNKYVFDGQTAKNSLDLKNLVATIGFLFEQKLVKAWITDKDAEALRCRKLHMEEEEAKQKSSKPPAFRRYVDTLKPSSSRGETSNQISADKGVLTIGSIPARLKSCIAQQSPDEVQDTVSHGETKSTPPVDRGNEDLKQDAMLEKVENQIFPGERSRKSQHQRCILCSDLDYVKEVLANINAERLAEEQARLVLSQAVSDSSDPHE